MHQLTKNEMKKKYDKNRFLLHSNRLWFFFFQFFFICNAGVRQNQSKFLCLKNFVQWKTIHNTKSIVLLELDRDLHRPTRSSCQDKNEKTKAKLYQLISLTINTNLFKLALEVLSVSISFFKCTEMLITHQKFEYKFNRFV